MEYLHHFWVALLELSYAMSPYIIIGLLFAGILHEFVPDSIVTKHLGKSNVASVIKSTLFGIPLPVCSCGVVPLATSIKKSGASKGATLSFLISTPITGIDSMLATYGIFGWIFTIYRVLSSIVMAIIAGILTNIFDKEEAVKKPAFSAVQTASLSMGSFSMKAPVATFGAASIPHASCCSSEKKNFWLTSALRYAFLTLLGDIAKPLIWGLLLGALITISIPESLSQLLTQYGWLSYLIVIAIAVPMYVCATASLPIAAGLMLSGVSAGAAFVFLSAGPATNTVTIGVVKKILGTRSLVIYLGSIILGSILFGLGLDYLFLTSQITPASLIHIHDEAGVFSILSSALLWVLVWYLILFRKK
ncbi:MAG: hypothetical protein RL113_380 [Pseudomonadota bacterium]|jgi:uncharacterized membrane protein YraQ (UPF0718 family)